MKKIYLPCLIILMLSGCCTQENYRRQLNARIGLTETELIEKIGNPHSMYQTDEKRSLEYEHRRLICSAYGCVTNWCTTRYIIKDGIVEQWSFQGNHCCSTNLS